MDRRSPGTFAGHQTLRVFAHCWALSIVLLSFSPYVLFDNLWIWYGNNEYVAGKRYALFYEESNLLTVIWKTDALDIWPSCSNFNSCALSYRPESGELASTYFSMWFAYTLRNFLSAEIQTQKVLLNSQRDCPMVSVSIWKAKSRSSKM